MVPYNTAMKEWNLSKDVKLLSMKDLELFIDNGSLDNQ